MTNRKNKIALVYARQNYDNERDDFMYRLSKCKKKRYGRFKVTKVRIFPKTAEKRLEKIEKHYDCIIPGDVKATELCAKFLNDSAKHEFYFLQA